MQAANDTQQRILASARDLIYARSYADVGVADICEHAGVKKGSFYHFFPSKRELTLAVLDAFYVDLKAQLVDKAFDNDIAPLARIARFALFAYEFQLQVFKGTGRVLGCPFGNLAVEMATQDESIRAKIEHIFANLQSLLRRELHAAQAAGDVSNLNVEATAQAMFAYFEGVMLLSKTRNDPNIVKHLLPAIVDIRIHTR
ncbi:MAG: TetR/AcrR family transcriptional regulator [Pseudomonadota bacterium]